MDNFETVYRSRERLSAQQIWLNLRGIDRVREALREARESAPTAPTLVCKEGRNEEEAGDRTPSLQDSSLAESQGAGTAEG